jgi:hypothetical protein
MQGVKSSTWNLEGVKQIVILAAMLSRRQASGYQNGRKDQPKLCHVIYTCKNVGNAIRSTLGKGHKKKKKQKTLRTYTA